MSKSKDEPRSDQSLSCEASSDSCLSCSRNQPCIDYNEQGRPVIGRIHPTSVEVATREATGKSGAEMIRDMAETEQWLGGLINAAPGYVWPCGRKLVDYGGPHGAARYTFPSEGCPCSDDPSCPRYVADADELLLEEAIDGEVEDHLLKR